MFQVRSGRWRGSSGGGYGVFGGRGNWRRRIGFDVDDGGGLEEGLILLVWDCWVVVAVG